IMKGKGNDIVGTLSLTINSLTTNCVARDENWTWSYRITTQAVRRCPGMGSCSADPCGRVQIHEKLQELTECHKKPSNLFCTDSCSIWWCGCTVRPIVAPFIHSCLFYCNYANAT